MKKPLNIISIVVFVLSLTTLLIINTGHHTQKSGVLIGYKSCNGNDFISVQSLGNSPNAGGPCLGAPVYSTSSMRGRYDINLNRYNTVLIIVVALSIIVFVSQPYSKRLSKK